MKLDKVNQNNEPGYPSFNDYRQNRRKFLMMLAAGIGVASVTGGCVTDGTPVPPPPPKNPPPPPPVGKAPRPPVPPDEHLRKKGEMPAPVAPKIDPPPQWREPPPAIRGDIAEPEPPQPQSP